MAQPSRQRKNNIDRTDGANRATELTSNPTQYHRGIRPQGRATSQFLNNLATFVGNQGLKSAREGAIESRKVSEADGASDALADTVDLDRMAVDPIYQQTVNTTQGDTAGYLLRVDGINAARAKLEEEGGGFDIEAWYDENIATGLQQDDRWADPAFRSAASAQLEQARKEVAQLGSQAYFAEVDAEAVNTARGSAFASMIGGDFQPTEWATSADDLGLSFQERDQAMVEAAVAASDRVDSLEKLGFLETVYDSLSDKAKPLFSAKLTNARRAAERRLEGGTAAETAGNLIESAHFRKDIERRLKAFTDRETTQPPTLEELEAGREAGYLSDSQFETAVMNRLDALDEVALYHEQMGETLEVFQHPESYATLDGDTKDFVDEYYEEVSNTASRDLMTTVASIARGTPPEEARAALYTQLEDFSWYYEQGARMGKTPPFTNYLNAAADPGVTNLQGLAELHDAVESRLGPGALRSVSSEATANLNAYRLLVNTGMEPEAAQAQIAERIGGMSLGAAKVFIGATEAFKGEVDDLIKEDEYVYDSYAQNAIHTLAAIQFRSLSNDPEASAKWARQEFERTHARIDGRWVPNRNIDEDFEAVYDDYKEDLTAAMVSAGYLEEGEKFNLLPTATTGGDTVFQLFNATTGLLVTDDDGDILDWSSREIKESVGAIETAAQLQKEAETTAQHRADVASNRQARIDNAPYRHLPIVAQNSIAFLRGLGKAVTGAERRSRPAPLPETPGAKPAVGNRRTPKPQPYDEEVLSEVNVTVDKREVNLAEASPVADAVDSDLLRQLAHHEGYRSQVYLDSEGVPTIGYGANLEEPHIQEWFSEIGVSTDALKEGQPLTEAQAGYVLRKSTQLAYEDAKKLVPELDDMPPPIRRVLIDMSFNLGYNRLKGFRKAIKAFNARDFETAANEMYDSEWRKQVKRRSRRLIAMTRSVGP